jgi:DNA-binding response OmpR family regulator
LAVVLDRVSVAKSLSWGLFRLSEEKEGREMTTAPTHRKTVLVIEDDPWTRTTEAALLVEEGYAVAEARNGDEGLRLALQHNPDVILLDLALPTTSGLDVLRELKGNPTTQHIPVLVVSAYGDLMGMSDTHQSDGVVQKPFDCDNLLAQVARVTSVQPASTVAVHS